MSAAHFQTFRENLAVKNADEISGRYLAITRRLNKDYWDAPEQDWHCLQVGSYGRKTAIDGVSDLDMAFELPWSVHDRFMKREGNIQSQLLGEIRDYLKVLYPTTPIRADGQVVVVQFKNYRVEVLPAFVEKDGSYKFPDSNNGGSWRWCWPRDEMTEMQTVNGRANRNLKHVCKMIRAWKNHKGAPMSGMLIDTLCCNFFKATTKYDDKSYASYPELLKDVFEYIANRPEQDYWLAPGSKDKVYPTGNFRPKAKKAAEKCQEALNATETKAKEDIWKTVFGRPFPRLVGGQKSASVAKTRGDSTEEFIQNRYPVDIRYDVRIECDVSKEGELKAKLRWLQKFLPLNHGRQLRFHVVHCSAPEPYQLFWKVRNVGPLAEKNGIRGQIDADGGKAERCESTNFAGAHYVECYVVKDEVCVARDRFETPIGDA